MAPSKILTSAEVRANVKETTDLLEAALPTLKDVEEHCAREDYALNSQLLGPGLDIRDHVREAVKDRDTALEVQSDLNRGRVAVTEAAKARVDKALNEIEQVRQTRAVAPPPAEEQERKLREAPVHVVVAALKILSAKSCLDMIRDLDPEVCEKLMSPELKRYKDLESLEVVPSSQLKERLEGMKNVNDILELRKVMESMDNELQAAKRQATVFQERLDSADARSLAMNQEQVLRTQLEEMLAAEKSRNAKGEEGLELRLAHMTQKYQNADMFRTQTANENKKLTAQLKQHEDTIKSLQKTADDANAEVERLKEQTERVETHDQMVTGLLAEAEAEAEAAAERHQQSAETLEQKSAEVARLGATVSSLHERLHQYEEELKASHQERREEFEQGVQRQAQRDREHESRLTALNSKMTGLTQELASVKAESAKRALDLASAEQRAKIQGSTLDSVNEQVVDRDAALQLAKEQVKARNAELEAMKEQVMSVRVSQIFLRGQVDEHVNELTSARQKIQEYRAELTSAEDKMRTCVSELAAARGEMAAYKTELARKQQPAEDRESQLAAARADAVKRDAELASAKAEVVKREAELALAKSQMTAQAGELAKAKGQVSDYQSELLSTRQQMVEYETKLASLNEQVTAQNTELATTKQHGNETKATLAFAEGQITAQRSELVTTTQRANEAEAKLASLNDQVTAQKTELATTKQHVEESEAKLARANQQITAQKTELATVRQHAKESEAELARAKGQITAQKSESSTAKQRADESEAKLAVANQQITVQNSELADVKGRISSLAQDLEQLKTAKVDGEKALEMSRAEIGRMVDDVARARELQTAKDNDLSELRALQADQGARMERMTAELAEAAELQTAQDNDLSELRALKADQDARMEQMAANLAEAAELQEAQGKELSDLRALVSFGATSLCNVFNVGFQWQSPHQVWPDLLRSVMVATVPARADKQAPWRLEVWPAELPSAEDLVRREVPHGWEALALGAALTSEGSTWETILPIVEAATLALASAEELPAQAFVNVMAQAAELLGEPDDANDNMGVLALMQATSIAGTRFSVEGVDKIQETLLPWLSNAEFAPLVSLVSDGHPGDVDAFEQQARSEGRLVNGRFALSRDILYVLIVDLELRRILAVHAKNQHPDVFRHRKAVVYKGPGGETLEMDLATLPLDVARDLYE